MIYKYIFPNQHTMKSWSLYQANTSYKYMVKLTTLFFVGYSTFTP